MAGCKQTRLHIGCKSDIELVERQREPISPGFEIGLFARPAAKKSSTLHLLWQRRQSRTFSWRKKPSGNLRRRHIGFHSFNIDAEDAPAAERNEDQIAGM